MYIFLYSTRRHILSVFLLALYFVILLHGPQSILGIQQYIWMDIVNTYGCETFCEKDFTFRTDTGYGATFLAVSNSRRRGKKNLRYSHRVKSSGRLFVPSDGLGAVQISFLQIYKQYHTNASKEFSISERRIPTPTYFVRKKKS